MSFYSNVYESHPAFFTKHTHKQTSIGLVAIVSFSQSVPPGWRKLNIQQGTSIKSQLLSMISTWGIVAFQTGKIDGSGYGNKISSTYGNQCGEGFFIYPYGGVPSDPSYYNESFIFNKTQAAPMQQNTLNNQAKIKNYSGYNQLENFQKRNTPLGVVIKVPLNLPVPQGFRILSLGQGVQIKQHLNDMLEQWSIVAFQNGKIDGNGYGNNISQSYGQQCGQKFIVANNPGFVFN